MSVLDAAAAPVSDLDPYAEEFLRDPYPRQQQLREAGAVVWLSRHRLWAVTRHEEVDTVLRDPQTYCSSRGVGLADFARETPWRPPSLLLEADPPQHTAARHAITAVLGPRTVREMRQAFESRAQQLVEELVRGGSFDAIHDLAERFPLTAMSDQIGVPQDGREHLLVYGALAFQAFGPRNERTERSLREGEQAAAWVAEHTRLSELRPGGLGARIHASAVEHGFSEQHAELLVRSVLTAGIDTTVIAIGNALWLLARHPEQWAALRDDPSLARTAFEEGIRVETPIQVFCRTTTRAVQLAGVPLAEGDKLLLLLAGANRDPRRWEDPERFEIRRSASGHVGFGAGIHACVGQMIARLEGEAVLSALAARVQTLEPAGEPRRLIHNTLRALSSLPLRVVAR